MAGYGKALNDRSSLYGILVYQIRIKAASEEVDAAFLLILCQLIGLRRGVGGWRLY